MHWEKHSASCSGADSQSCQRSKPRRPIVCSESESDSNCDAEASESINSSDDIANFVVADSSPLVYDTSASDDESEEILADCGYKRRKVSQTRSTFIHQPNRKYSTQTQPSFSQDPVIASGRYENHALSTEPSSEGEIDVDDTDYTPCKEELYNDAGLMARTPIDVESFAELPSIDWEDEKLEPGTAVRFYRALLDHDDDPHVFMKITRILRGIDDAIYLEGICFCRAKDLKGELQDSNDRDLVLLAHVDEDEKEIVEKQILRVIKLSQVLCVCPLRLSSETTFSPLISNELVCRWIRVFIHKDGQLREDNKNPPEGVLRPLRPSEADSTTRLATRAVRAAAQSPSQGVGKKVAGLPTKPGSRVLKAKPLGKIKYREARRAAKRTMLDLCAGGGGVTLAGHNAGFAVTSVEIDKTCQRSHKLNFPQSKFLREDVSQMDEWHPLVTAIVDYLHASFPCPPWSAANPKKGPKEWTRDNKKQANLLFSIDKAIKHFRPKLISLEQVCGLHSLKIHRWAFNKLLRCITRNGYSVSWKVVDFRDHGLGVRRIRLIFYASRDDVPLPAYPPATASQEGGSNLPPWTSRLRALSISEAESSSMSSSQRNEANEPFRNCVLTRGSGLHHPIEDRALSITEIAKIQQMDTLRLAGTATQVLRQIGNAVPPKVMEQFSEACMQLLLELDSGAEKVTCSRYNELDIQGLYSQDIQSNERIYADPGAQRTEVAAISILKGAKTRERANLKRKRPFPVQRNAERIEYSEEKCIRTGLPIVVLDE